MNTIQCGPDPVTAQIWQEIARLSQGEYAAIAQDGAMIAESTPMDDELATLNREVSETVLAYGDADERGRAHGEAAPDLPSAPVGRSLTTGLPGQEREVL